MSKKNFRKIVFLLFGVCISLSIWAQASIPSGDIKMDSLSVEQLQQAAEAGDPDAQYALGYIYYYGKNVPQNTTTGLNWIKRASVQDQQQAVQAMRELELTPANAQKKAEVQPVVMNKEEPNELDALQDKVVKISVMAAQNLPEMKNVPGNYYTIQLLVTSNKAELNRYVQQHGLGNKATYSLAKNRVRYTLLYGTYKTRSEAQASLLKLPAAVRAQKPWIKQVNQVKGK